MAQALSENWTDQSDLQTLPNSGPYASTKGVALTSFVLLQDAKSRHLPYVSQGYPAYLDYYKDLELKIGVSQSTQGNALSPCHQLAPTLDCTVRQDEFFRKYADN